MKTQQAVLKVLNRRSGLSKYRLAKTLGVQPIMIDHYLNGSRMKQDTADLFKEFFDITITDVYSPTQDSLERRKHETEEVPGSGE